MRLERLETRRLLSADVADEAFGGYPEAELVRFGAAEAIGADAAATGQAKMNLGPPPRSDGDPEDASLASTSTWSVGPHPLQYESGTAGTQQAGGDYVTMIANGPSSNRVDIVFAGDGYTPPELDVQYAAHVESMLDHMFNSGEAPFPRYANFFNAHRVLTESNESGADRPDQGIEVDTAFDASYSCAGIERLICVSNSKVDAAVSEALSETSIDVDMRLLAVNDTKYGGSGGRYAVYAGGNSSSPEIAVHEIGHSFSNLADEYWNSGSGDYSGFEPFEVNVTTDASGEKWSRWLGYEQPIIGEIGVYEGGRYYERGMYRPSLNSKMRSLGRPFDAISREKIVLDIYTIIDPLDRWRDNGRPVSGPDPELWVQPIDPDVIKVDWLVDGEPVPTATGTSFRPAEFGFEEGEFEITARAYDPTEWVRTGHESLEQAVSWDVTVMPPPTVESVTVNGGARQRSSLDRLAVTFSTEVALDAAGGAPIRVERAGAPAESVPVDFGVTASGGKTVIDLTFAPGSLVNASGSLLDGRYQLIVDAARVASTAGVALDGDGDGSAGGDHVFGESDGDRFFRNYGDADGSGVVDLLDFAAFRRTFGKTPGEDGYLAELDADGDGPIDLTDFAAFRRNFGG